MHTCVCACMNECTSAHVQKELCKHVCKFRETLCITMCVCVKKDRKQYACRQEEISLCGHIGKTASKCVLTKVRKCGNKAELERQRNLCCS